MSLTKRLLAGTLIVALTASMITLGICLATRPPSETGEAFDSRSMEQITVTVPKVTVTVPSITVTVPSITVTAPSYPTVTTRTIDADTIVASVKVGIAEQIFADGVTEPISVLNIRDEAKIVTRENSFVEYCISDYFRIMQGGRTMFEFKEVKLIEGKLLSLLHWGKVYGYIKKDGKVIKEWLIRTPAALIKTSQTEFVLEVAENGATTLTVLTGEVDLSDLSMNKTVTVKQNEKSTVQPGGTPSYPEPASPDRIERWWEITEITETTETTEASEITEATEAAETTEATEGMETTESTSTPQGFADGNCTWLVVVATIALAALIAAVLARKKLGSSKANRSTRDVTRT